MTAPSPWHAEAVRWAREGVSCDEAADRWGIEPEAARARLVRAAQRAKVEIAGRKRRGNAEVAAMKQVARQVLAAGGGTHEVADALGVSTTHAAMVVCKIRRALGIPAKKGPASRLQPRGYEPVCSSSAPREGGRYVSLSEAREVAA